MKVLVGRALLLVPAALLAGCGNHEHVQGFFDPAAPSVAGHTFVVTGLTVDGKSHALVKGSEIRLRFDTNRLTVTAGCNTMSGAYRLDGPRLRVGGLAGTEMACAEERMDQDTWVAGLFEGPVQLTTGSDASLISGTTVLSLADREQVAPDEPLIGTTWVLDTITEGQTSSSVPGHGSGTIEFDKDGGFRSVVGCGSQRGGKVTVEGNRLSFADNMSGIADCVPPDGVDPDQFYAGPHAVQAAFGEVLVDGATFAITEDRLTITFGDHAVGLRARG